MAASLISICQRKRPCYRWLNEAFVSRIQQKLDFATHEPLDYQAAKISISDWWKFITTPERSEEIRSILVSAWHLSYLEWTCSLGSFAEHKWSYLPDWTHSQPPHPPHPPPSRQITSFKRIWQCIKCSARDTYVRAYSEISLQQMLIHIYVVELPPVLGVFFSWEYNKLLQGPFRAKTGGHLSPSYGRHIKTDCCCRA